MAAPLTNILIRVTDPCMVQDIWKLFDHIVAEMEKIGEDGLPIVDALGRKRFRWEVMKAKDADVMEVFSRWVTILVPSFVPLAANIKQTDGALNQAKRIVREQERGKVEEEKKEKAEDIKKRRKAVKKMGPTHKILHLGTATPEERHKMRLAREKKKALDELNGL